MRAAYEAHLRAFWEKRHALYLRAHTQELTDREAAGHSYGEGDALELLPAYRVPRARAEERLAGSPPVWEALKFYQDHFEKTDRGGVRLFNVPVGSQQTWAIYVTTDGDDGWLEVYDPVGVLFGAACTYIEVIGWADRAAVRAAISGGPKKIVDGRKTLWGRQPLDETPADPVAGLDSDREGTRLASLIALEKHPPEVPPVEAVRARLVDASPAVGRQAARTLGAWGKRALAARAQLISARDESGDLSLRVEAQHALIAMGVAEPHAPARLCQGLNDAQLLEVMLGPDMTAHAVAIDELSARYATVEAAKLFGPANTRLLGGLRYQVMARAKAASAEEAARLDETMFGTLAILGRVASEMATEASKKPYQRRTLLVGVDMFERYVDRCVRPNPHESGREAICATFVRLFDHVGLDLVPLLESSDEVLRAATKTNLVTKRGQTLLMVAGQIYNTRVHDVLFEIGPPARAALLTLTGDARFVALRDDLVKKLDRRWADQARLPP